MVSLTLKFYFYLKLPSCGFRLSGYIALGAHQLGLSDEFTLNTGLRFELPDTTNLTLHLNVQMQLIACRHWLFETSAINPDKVED
jgi:hypothetical protein